MYISMLFYGSRLCWGLEQNAGLIFVNQRDVCARLIDAARCGHEPLKKPAYLPYAFDPCSVVGSDLEASLRLDVARRPDETGCSV